jgi:hypothetical protein
MQVNKQVMSPQGHILDTNGAQGHLEMLVPSAWARDA